MKRQDANRLQLSPAVARSSADSPPRSVRGRGQRHKAAPSAGHEAAARAMPASEERWGGSQASNTSLSSSFYSSAVTSRHTMGRVTLRPAGSAWSGVAVSVPRTFGSLQRRGLRMLHLFSQRGGMPPSALSSVTPADVVIELNANNVIVLENFDIADLDASDFMF